MARQRFDARSREIVKITRTATSIEGVRYRIRDKDCNAVQFRTSLDGPYRKSFEGGARVIYAYAYVNAAGRWHLAGPAPVQEW